MPRSKKGRITGAARKEINARRAADAVAGSAEGIAFGRMTKMTGSGHCIVAIEGKHGPLELRCRIPNIFGRRGATPITNKDVVSLYVGKEFDAEDPAVKLAHFDINSILNAKQVYQLHKAGEIPSWMATDTTSMDAAGAGDCGGFEFAHDEGEEAEESEDSEGTGFNRKAARDAADEIDVDDI
jgi:hypothetical protein